MRRILLNKSRSKESVNEINSIPVEINRDVSLFHHEIMTDIVDTMQVYNKEKDKSQKHRIIVTIYPICSNSLFNNITEVVYTDKSGMLPIIGNISVDRNDKMINSVSTESKIDSKQVIRNTEYSIENENYSFTYNCGADIFNNHLLRSKDNISVQKRKGIFYCDIYKKNGDTIKKEDNPIDSFNTIGDISRSYEGNAIKTLLPDSANNYSYLQKKENNLSLYISDSIKTFFEAYSDGLQRKDGWIGFKNPSTLRIKMGNGTYINKCINNKDACQFIDLTPERNLFSFSPQKNETLKRTEKNWDYFITYPSESIYNDGKLLIGNGMGLPLSKFGNYYYKEYNSDNGINMLLFRSPVKHNLKNGDKIKLIFNNSLSTKTYNISVVRTGDENNKNKDRYFSIYKSDIESYLNGIQSIRFVKVINGFECEYYFRKFKVIDNIDSTITKLAFADTIYGDEVSQIIFTDDINITDLKDNRGYPLTELYFTVLKTNRGHEEWYEKQDYDSSNIECSRIFGKVTSGLDLPVYADKDLPVIRYQHNINSGDIYAINDVLVAQKSSSKLEYDIIGDDGIFYGDLVEFNPVSLNETIIEDVIHRFNTAQREVISDLYDTIYYDEIIGDSYDSYMISNNGSNIKIYEHELNNGYANLNPEGYIYKPHHRIQIGKFDDIIKQIDNEIIVYSDGTTISFDEFKTDIILKTKTDYSLKKGDNITVYCNGVAHKFNILLSIYNKDEKEYLYQGTTNQSISTIDIDNMFIFKNSIEIPDYAYMLPDGSGRLLYKTITKPSEYVFTDELYKIPFTNGAFYHNSSIIFTVKRQDPFKHYGMQVTKENLPIENNFEIPSVEFDYSGYEYFDENETTSCF